MATADLTVMGGGIFGLAVALACASRGARVRLIEKRAIGAGASGGLVGALAPHVPENWNPKKQFQLDALLMSGPYWQDIEQTTGLPTGYTRSGRLQPLADDRAVTLARARSEAARTLWAGHATWSVIPAASYPGWAPSSPTGFLIHDTLTARIHPRLACAALAARLAALGGTIEAGIEPPAEITSGPTLWATGYEGLLQLSPSLGQPAGSGVKGQALTLAHDAAQLPQLFADTVHIVPHADRTVAIGSTSERLFDDATSTDTQLDSLHARALAACPALTGAPILERWAGVRPRAASRAPLLGTWPDRPGHYIANGGFKIGLGIAPLVGCLMADLILEGKNAIPPDFRPEALRR